MKSYLDRRVAPLTAGLALLIVLSSGGCMGTETSSVAGPIRFSSGVDRLHSWLCGRFDSSAQAEGDSAFRSISLHGIPIWPDREDGRWLYVEEAASDALDRPSRQLAHRVRNDAQGGLISEVLGSPRAKSPLPDRGKTPTTSIPSIPRFLSPARAARSICSPSRDPNLPSPVEPRAMAVPAP
jgi:hypothetical protein